MSDRARKIYLLTCIFAPFLVYCIYYYSKMVGKAAYNFKEFEYISYKYGPGNNMLNSYDSRTGIYIFETETNDSLKKFSVKLTNEELQEIHRKMIDMNFFDIPSAIKSVSEEYGGVDKGVVYEIDMAYTRKTKSVKWSVSSSNSNLNERMGQLVLSINKTLSGSKNRKPLIVN